MKKALFSLILLIIFTASVCAGVSGDSLMRGGPDADEGGAGITLFQAAPGPDGYFTVTATTSPVPAAVNWSISWDPTLGWTPPYLITDYISLVVVDSTTAKVKAIKPFEYKAAIKATLVANNGISAVCTLDFARTLEAFDAWVMMQDGPSLTTAWALGTSGGTLYWGYNYPDFFYTAPAELYIANSYFDYASGSIDDTILSYRFFIYPSMPFSLSAGVDQVEVEVTSFIFNDFLETLYQRPLYISIYPSNYFDIRDMINNLPHVFDLRIEIDFAVRGVQNFYSSYSMYLT